jgi:hypothetical protein
MEQEVTHSRGGCNSRHALKVPGEMTSMFHMYIKDSSQVHRNGWMDTLSDALECMDS